MLAPVAAEIDLNLQRIRDIPPEQVALELELELDQPDIFAKPDERAKLVLRQAVRNVELHGWDAGISADWHRLTLNGGSVSLDLGLSDGITQYIRDGVAN
jgi:hypothetical protein